MAAREENDGPVPDAPIMTPDEYSRPACARSHTFAAAAMGTPANGAGTRLFSAPEQVAGHPLGAPADAWGLGVLLYRAALGRLPFDAVEGHPQLTTPATLIRTECPGGGDIAPIIDALLHPSPASRPILTWVAVVLDELAGAHRPHHRTT